MIAIEVPSKLASQQRNLKFTVKNTDNQLKLFPPNLAARLRNLAKIENWAAPRLVK